MSAVNLFLLTRNKDIGLCSEYENTLSNREKREKVKEHEYESLCSLVKDLTAYKLTLTDLEGFHFSFNIGQIPKEFDLLKIKNGERILNIELKSKMIEESRIKKQLVQNQYYLKYIADRIDSFTYVADEHRFFTLNDGGLVECSISDLANVLIDFTEYDEEIEPLFDPKNYLVSPLNTPEKFLDGQYFLTNAQKDIKKEIIADVQKEKPRRFWGITGNAGTGKTLVLYDLARELTKIGKVCMIHCGITCEGHEILDQQIDGLDIIAAKMIEEHNFEDYRFIMVDETQRIYKKNLETVCNLITETDMIGIFSYDEIQTLSMSEERNKTVDVIKGLDGFKEEKLTDKIRTNKETDAFTQKLFNLNRRIDIPYKYDKIDIIYADSIDEARQITSYYRRKKGYIFIEYTKWKRSQSPINEYSGDINTHQVIGQEYDNVVMVLDDNFYYSEKKHLETKEHPSGNYLFSKLLYQGLSRAKVRLCLVIVDNPDLFKKVLGIKYDAIHM